MKVIIGAGKTAYEGWISTQENELDLLSGNGDPNHPAYTHKIFYDYIRSNYGF